MNFNGSVTNWMRADKTWYSELGLITNAEWCERRTKEWNECHEQKKRKVEYKREKKVLKVRIQWE